MIGYLSPISPPTPLARHDDHAPRLLPFYCPCLLCTACLPCCLLLPTPALFCPYAVPPICCLFFVLSVCRAARIPACYCLPATAHACVLHMLPGYLPATACQLLPMPVSSMLPGYLLATACQLLPMPVSFMLPNSMPPFPPLTSTTCTCYCYFRARRARGHRGRLHTRLHQRPQQDDWVDGG